MVKINWNYNDEILFKSKLKKWGLFRFTLEVEKLIWKKDWSDEQYEKLAMNLQRLYDLRDERKIKGENKLKNIKQSMMFRKLK